MISDVPLSYNQITLRQNHSTLESSAAINISNTIPPGPAALPCFILLKSFQNLISSNQFTGSLYLFTRCDIIPRVLIQQFLHVLSPQCLHLIIFYQHFSMCIFDPTVQYGLWSCKNRPNPIAGWMSQRND